MGWGAMLGGAIGSYWGPTGTAIGAGAGGVVEQGVANDYNTKAVDAKREWDEYMAGTAIRRTMTDYKEAGLNPMLVYSSGASSVPSTAAPQYANISEPSSAVQAVTQQEATQSTVKLQREQTREAASRAGIAENELRKLDALINAMALVGGYKNLIHMSEKDEALTEFFRKAQADPELQAALASVEEQRNNAAFHKFISQPATNVVMQALQLILKAIMVSKGK